MERMELQMDGRSRNPGGVLSRLGLSVLLAAAGAGCVTPGAEILDVSPRRWRRRSARGVSIRPRSRCRWVRRTTSSPSARQTAAAGTDRERLERLHAALFDRKVFAFEYEKMATFTAAEAFIARRGNCVSLTNLLLAMARSLGIRLRPGLILRRQSSERQGDLVLRFAHMVAVYSTSGS